MLNYWWVTRPKRKLNSIPEVLSSVVATTLDAEWDGQRNTHLALENALEKEGLKRQGDRRDQTGGGARTYMAWLKSLGLIFTQNDTGKMKLTLAGEALIAGDSPITVLTNQILRYQFPSAFSISRGVRVADRFKIRPFRFMLRLLRDKRLEYYFTEEELAKIIVTEADKETDSCYEYIVKRLIDFRSFGDSCLDKDFCEKYQPSKGGPKYNDPFSHLKDLANTLVNWLDYTQLILRDNGKVSLHDDKIEEVNAILARTPPFIDRWQDEEFFQRKYGIDPKHRKDTRDLNNNQTITAAIVNTYKIKNAYIAESLKTPITKITSTIISKIAEKTGIAESIVEDTLLKLYPDGSISNFLSNYYNMAFNGRDDATEFEKATVQLFQDVFGFKAEHVGPIGLTPDVLILSDEANYQAIIDNKAYSQYSISNDHHNRMVHNYIGNLQRYSQDSRPLAFFTYIAGGFSNNINNQLLKITAETNVNGSAMTVSNMIKLVEMYKANGYTHETLRSIFSINRRLLSSDL